MSGQDELEIAVEEWGEHSWLKALVNTLSGSYGSAQYRFVARLPGEHEAAGQNVFVGATFPVMRAQSLDNTAEPNAWMETMRSRLQDLDRELTAAGWRRADDIGEHWWSYRYHRVDPPG